MINRDAKVLSQRRATWLAWDPTAIYPNTVVPRISLVMLGNPAAK
jgi:hypothetical protein